MEKKMRSILVVNPKGGCGKTTIATNLASYYAIWDVPTALVDFDPQKSSLEWLDARPADASPIQGLSGESGVIEPHEDTVRIIYDAPARTDTAKVGELIKVTDAVIIPVLPSAIDMRSAARFLSELLIKHRIRESKTPVAVVGNRVHSNYLSSMALERFLNKVDIPFITSFRETQNYVRAADQGIGIFEMIPSMVNQDLEQWRPLINWIEGK
jgi:chromosome partitioning protein